MAVSAATSPTRKLALDLLPLLAVALALRLWQIDLTHFDLDQSTLLTFAGRFLDTGQPPLTSGLTYSSGGAIPPLITYLVALPMLFTRDPVALSGFQATLDAGGVVFMYLLGRELKGRWAGLCAGALYASSPAAIQLSRILWNPSLVPLLGVVALWALVTFHRTGNTRRLAIACVATGCATLLHITSAPLWLVVAAVAIQKRRNLAWRPLATGGLVLALIASPYLVRQVTTGWADLDALLVDAANSPRHFGPKAFTVAHLLAVGDLRQQVSGSLDTTAEWRLPLQVSNLVGLGLLALGAARALRTDRGWILLLWLALPILTTLRALDPLPPHYQAGVIPAAVALGGLGLASLRPRRIGAGLLTGILLWRTIAELAFWDEVAAGNWRGSYGTPLRYSLQAVQSLDGMTTPLYVGEGTFHGGIFQYLIPSRSAVPAAQVRVFDATASVLLGSAGTYLVDAESDGDRWLARQLGAPTRSIVSSTARPLLNIYQAPRDLEARYRDRISPLGADVGHLLEVRGFATPLLEMGGAGRATLLWKVLDADPDRWRDLRWFGVLVDADGTRRSSRPDGFVPRGQWQPGDAIVSWLNLSVPDSAPPGGYPLEVGFYYLDGFRQLPIYEGDRVVAQTLRLGPVRVQPAGGPGASTELAIFGAREIALTQVSVQNSTVSLVWRALAGGLADYTVFVHALDGNGNLVAGHDGLPGAGTFPTPAWQAGDLIADQHVLAGDLSHAAALAIGLYRTTTIERLSAADIGGARSESDRYLHQLQP